MFFLHGIYQLLKLCVSPCLLVFHCLLQTEEKTPAGSTLFVLRVFVDPGAQFIAGFQIYFE